jgi:hypothetical protein
MLMLKRVVGFALLLSVAGILAAVPSSSVASQKAATMVTISLTPSSASGGAPVAVRGRLVLVRLARPVAGQKIAIQRRVAGTRTWRTVTRATTAADGSYQATVRSTVSADFRARYAGNRKLRGDLSNANRFRANQFVEVTGQGPEIVDAGQPIILTGVTSVGLRSQRIFLDQFIGGAWKQIAQATVSPSGAFRVAGTTSTGGFDIPFRVRSIQTAALLAAYSTPSTFTVYAWYPLSSLTPLQAPEENAQSTNFRVKASNSIAGTSFPNSYNSLYAVDGFDKFEAGRAGFQLTTQCSSLQTTIGIDDSAGANAAWQFLVYLDGNEYNLGFFEKGDSQYLNIGVTAVNRIRLVNNRRVVPPDDASYRANAVWGGARIKCAGKP